MSSRGHRASTGLPAGTMAAVQPTSGAATPVQSQPAPKQQQAQQQSQQQQSQQSQQPLTAKARRLLREAEERAAKEQQEEEHNVHSYNEMLKKLLSKEIAAREAQESKVAELTLALESFKSTEMDVLRASHAKQLEAQAEQVTARVSRQFEQRMDALVLDRVTAARAADTQKYSSLAEIQSKLHLEFEDKYAQRLSREQRAAAELQEQLAQAQTRIDEMAAEAKKAAAAYDAKLGVIKALEWRVVQLEKLKVALRRYRTLTRALTCRVFINTVRLKRNLHGVYDSLRSLHEKLVENADYDRTSECILPQHELESWLAKVEKMVAKPRVIPSTANAAIAAANASFGTNPVSQAQTAAAAATAAGASAPNSKAAAQAAAASQSTTGVHPNTLTQQAADLGSAAGGASTKSAPSPIVISRSPLPPGPVSAGSSSGRKKKGPRRTQSFLPSGFDFGASPFSEDSTGADSERDRERERERELARERDPPRLGYSLNFHHMLSAIGEVELVLRGCLIECLAKAAEWKASCEDFFLRNQELVAENQALREGGKRATAEVAALQAALTLLENNMGAAGSGGQGPEERKAIMEMNALTQGGSGGGTNGASAGKAARGGGGSDSHRASGASRDNAARLRLTAAAREFGGPDQNGLDKSLASRGVEVRSFSGDVASIFAPPSTADQSRAAQAAQMLEQHRVSQRLAGVDPSSASAIHSLSAAELAELSRSAHKPGSTAVSFFDHHNALMQVVMLQKSDLEKLRRTLGVLRAQKEQLKAQVKQSREAQEFAYQVGEAMDGDVEAGQLATAETAGADDGGFEEQKEPAAAPSPRATDGRKSARRSGPASRPSQLDVDTSSAGDSSRQIRALIPFSPPVGPVSPWGTAAASPAATGRPHSSAAGLGSLNSSPYAAAAPRGHGMSMHVPASSHQHHHGASKVSAADVQRPSTSGGIVSSSSQSQHSSPYSSYPSRAQSAIPTSAPPKSAGSAASSRMSPGAALLAASLAQTQPITTSSQSYASTTVYAPAVHLYTPGPYAHVHAASRNAEKMYGHSPGAAAVPAVDSPNAAVVSRPRTSSGTVGHSSRAAATSARIINPLLSAGLVPASSVAAAMTQQRSVALHPSLQLTGDVRYDIISPYVAAPLPWEKKAAPAASATGANGGSAAHAPASPATRDSTPASSARDGAERRRKATQYGNAVTERHAAQKTAQQQHAQQLHMQETAFGERPFQAQKKEQEQQEQREREQQQQAAFESILRADDPTRPASSSSRAGRPSSAARMRPSQQQQQQQQTAGSISPAAPISPAPSRPLSSHSNSAAAAVVSGSSSANMSPRSGPPAKKSPINAPPQSAANGAAFNFSQHQQQGLSVPTPTPPPSRPGAPSPQSSAVPSVVTSPVSDYRSLRTGGAIGQRPHAAVTLNTAAAQRVSLNANSRHEYEDDPFDRSRSQSSMRPSAAPAGSKAAAAHAAADDDHYSDDDDMIRQDDLRRDDSNNENY